ncbi:MerR HTH family regulatory protein [Tepidimonas alkaliphilus]|uniref:MerR HTH family regulatory protein n=1 Tax=Tepidimonas alkaliphilus TaxID=2588942 RepID=A0A554W3S5_9BURK|nr:MerR family transcriptional regulator [Tepidimonas alkaliphilus]TSE18213.1 MerR HTH family regulatory protein [Tepidimonas alkaliphilus]
MTHEATLPPIPPKRYFTISEVSELCGVKPHVLRYWEQEFTQLRPMKRRGNRRYYQHHEVLLIRRIRELLYEEGFTIQGARHRLAHWPITQGRETQAREAEGSCAAETPTQKSAFDSIGIDQPAPWAGLPAKARHRLAAELRAICALLPPSQGVCQAADDDAL